MSRSYRKHDWIGVAGNSEKEDKRVANRTLRHHVKRLIHVNPEEETFPIMREVSDKWGMSKDGKFYFGDMLSEHVRHSQKFGYDLEHRIKVYRDFKSK